MAEGAGGKRALLEVVRLEAPRLRLGERRSAGTRVPPLCPLRNVVSFAWRPGGLCMSWYLAETRDRRQVGCGSCSARVLRALVWGGGGRGRGSWRCHGAGWPGGVGIRSFVRYGYWSMYIQGTSSSAAAIGWPIIAQLGGLYLGEPVLMLVSGLEHEGVDRHV